MPHWSQLSGVVCSFWTTQTYPTEGGRPFLRWLQSHSHPKKLFANWIFPKGPNRIRPLWRAVSCYLVSWMFSPWFKGFPTVSSLIFFDIALEKLVFPEGKQSPNQHFSGAMLVSRRVTARVMGKNPPGTWIPHMQRRWQSNSLTSAYVFLRLRR